ncbi:short-chain dehydrogenase/reductase [Aspergillus pseudoustus]|uniref:Short-chain dehydrogenase/reductase n=1 Tax=Aspergillus pseudoustus TaxID=1810923 RepID=A0ABR4J1X5_9EURO
MNIGKKSVPFKADRDIPPLDGKVILVTGGNIGLGKQCVLEYAKHNPAKIYLAARTPSKAQAALDEIQKALPRPANIVLLDLDLASLDSVKKAASTVLAESERLDILMLNAGIMAAPPSLTKDGYELQFGTNYLGHALLAKLLTPLLEKTALLALPDSEDVRIITLSSHGHMYAPKPDGIRYETLRTPADSLGAYGRYGQSKLAAILWARHAATLYPQFTIAAIHPELAANKVVVPVEQGVRNQLWASVAKEGVTSGGYYEPVGIGGTATELGKDEKLAQRLWEWTEEELKGYTL